MQFFTTGIETVDKMGQLNISGNIKPAIWNKTISRALIFLEELGVLKRVFRTIKNNNGMITPNVMFLELNYERLYELTFPDKKNMAETTEGNNLIGDEYEMLSEEYAPDNGENAEKTQELSMWTNLTTPMDKYDHTYGHNYSHIRTNVSVPMDKDDRTNTYIGMDFLDENLIAKARKRACLRTQNHAWENMTDEEILRSSGLILRDIEKNKEGITLAAILLFGKNTSILSVLPQYKTDAIYRVENLDRYDDREIVATNLIDSFEQLMAFGKKHLNDSFIMEGDQSISARDKILREIISNILAHRDYSSGYPAKFIIEKDRIYTENGNLAHGKGVLRIDSFNPFPKNPTISKVFREIGYADELGSGMRNTNKYAKLYANSVPSFEEGDIFKITIPTEQATDVKMNVTRNEAQGEAQGNLEKMIIDLVRRNSHITRVEMAEKIGVSKATIERQLKKMPNVKYVGSGYSGHWEVTE